MKTLNCLEKFANIIAYAKQSDKNYRQLISRLEMVQMSRRLSLQKLLGQAQRSPGNDEELLQRIELPPCGEEH